MAVSPSRVAYNLVTVSDDFVITFELSGVKIVSLFHLLPVLSFLHMLSFSTHYVFFAIHSGLHFFFSFSRLLSFTFTFILNLL